MPGYPAGQAEEATHALCIRLCLGKLTSENTTASRGLQLARKGSACPEGTGRGGIAHHQVRCTSAALPVARPGIPSTPSPAVAV